MRRTALQKARKENGSVASGGAITVSKNVRVDQIHRVRQCSLSQPAAFEGVGLHSGEDCRVIVNPAPIDAGLLFVRRDGAVGNADGDAEGDAFRATIAASPENVIRSDHGTTLGNAFGASIATVEHLLAALSISQIDNAFIDVCGPEIPILDGSAAPFMEGFESAGVHAQSAQRSTFDVTEPVHIVDGDRAIFIEPADDFSLKVDIEFEDCMIGQQSLSITLRDADEIARIASARTFCRLTEVDALRRVGLIRGGSLDNSLVVDGERLLNDAGLRDSHEFVLHKALDLIGDLYLLGMPVRGAVHAIKPGHDLNCRAALALYRRLHPARRAAAV